MHGGKDMNPGSDVAVLRAIASLLEASRMVDFVDRQGGAWMRRPVSRRD